jgi:RNA polymerase sigma-B factor
MVMLMPSTSTLGCRLPKQRGNRAPLRYANRTTRVEHTAQLLAEASATSDDAERHRLLDEVVLLNMGVANALAARYRHRGVSIEDLRQVAYLALVKAARGFDSASGHEFLSYAVPTIRGEIKRHFRDHGWSVRPPRRIQELQGRIAIADSELSAALGRSPRPAEVADHLGTPLDDVLEALAADGCFTPTSLDRPVGPEGDTTIGEMLGNDDRGRDAAEARVLLGPALRNLSERDRRILMLRFFRGWTQSEIAEDIGVTQMQVSRLLSRILEGLREELSVQDDISLDSSPTTAG